MPHSAPNIPESSPGNIRSSTLNGIKDSIRGTANNHYGNGVQSNSQSTGNSSTVDETFKPRSFWAQITRKLRYFNKPPLSYFRIPNGEKPKKRTSEYDFEERYDGGPSQCGNLILPSDPAYNSASIYYRNPWESYDGYMHSLTSVRSIDKDGNLRSDQNGNPIFYSEYKFDEYQTYTFPMVNSPGMQNFPNPLYYDKKESRYFYYGASKGVYGEITAGVPTAQLREIEWFIGYCPQYFWCYGWCELVEDLDLRRGGMPFFRLASKSFNHGPSLWKSCRRPEPIVNEPDPYEPEFQEGVKDPRINNRPFYSCSEANIATKYMSHGGEFGNAMAPNRAHEVNNCNILVGQIVRMWKGKGDYYLFNNPQCPQDLGLGWSDIQYAPYHFWHHIYEERWLAGGTNKSARW